MCSVLVCGVVGGGLLRALAAASLLIGRRPELLWPTRVVPPTARPPAHGAVREWLAWCCWSWSWRWCGSETTHGTCGAAGRKAERPKTDLNVRAGRQTSAAHRFILKPSSTITVDHENHLNSYWGFTDWLSAFLFFSGLTTLSDEKAAAAWKCSNQPFSCDPDLPLDLPVFLKIPSWMDFAL